MAPELLVKKNYDPLKADVWAFGIMMYWVAMGYYPQDADTKKRKIQNNKIDELHLHFPVDINPGLEYLLRKMLNPNPK
jgi:serine/threonine protein kinase